MSPESPCFSIRPKRAAAAKPKDYVEKKQKRTLFRHAANVYFALGMGKVANACRALGLDDAGADWEGVKYYIKKFKQEGTDKMFEEPTYRARALRAAGELECARLPVTDVGAGGSPPALPAETDGTVDKEEYDAAVMAVGKLMSAKVGRLSRRKAIEKVRAETGITASNSAASKSCEQKGLVPPSKRGRPLVASEAADDLMVKVVQLLIHHRLPRKKHLVLAFANNMAQQLGLDVGETLGSGWFYRFRERHSNLFDLDSARGLEKVRADWLTSKNAARHYETAADVFVKCGIASKATDAETNATVVNGEVIDIIDATRFGSFDEARTSIDTYEDKSRGKDMSDKHAPKDAKSEVVEVRGNGNITVVAGSRGDGLAFPPMVIFPRKAMVAAGMRHGQQNWTSQMWARWAKEAPVSPIPGPDGKPMSTLVYGNESGGMSHGCGALYAKHVIVPSFGERTPDRKAVILCDGHGSHLTYGFLKECKDSHITVILRPPHTTSRLQTEDQKPNFGVMQEALRKAKEQAMVDAHFDGGRTPSVWDYMKVLNVAWHKGFSRVNCRRAWAMIGIMPFTRCVFWDLVREEMARKVQESQAKSREASNAKKVEEAIKAGLTAEDLMKGQPILRAIDNPKGDCDSGDDRDSDSDGGGDCSAPVSSNVWKKPATVRETLKAARRYEIAKKRKVKEAEQKKSQAAAKRRKKKRAANSTGQGALAQLKAAGLGGWRDALGRMKAAELDGLAVCLGLECKFEGTKPQKRELLEPEVETWWGEQPVTRDCAGGDN
eukprot:g4693.t1